MLSKGRFVHVSDPVIVTTRSPRRRPADAPPPTKVAVSKQPVEAAPPPKPEPMVTISDEEAAMILAEVKADFAPKLVAVSASPVRVASNAEADAIVARQRTAFAAMLSAHDQPADVLEPRLEREEATILRGLIVVEPPPPVTTPAIADMVDTSKQDPDVAALLKKFNPPAPTARPTSLTIPTGRVVDDRPRRHKKAPSKSRSDTPLPNRDLVKIDRWTREDAEVRRALLDQVASLDPAAIEAVTNDPSYSKVWVRIMTASYSPHTWRRQQAKLEALRTIINSDELGWEEFQQAKRYVAALEVANKRFGSKSASAK